MNSRLSELKAGVTEAGFRPAPFARVLWAMRRLLWPVIRQYHFFQLEQLAATAAELDQTRAQVGALDSALRDLLSSSAAQQAQIRETLAQFASQLSHLSARQNEFVDEVSKAAPAHFQLRSDVAALVNRQDVLAQEASGVTLVLHSVEQRLVAEAQRIEALALSHAGLAADLAASSRRGEEGHAVLQGIVAREAELHHGLAAIGNRNTELGTELERLTGKVDAQACLDRVPASDGRLGDRVEAAVVESQRLRSDLLSLSLNQTQLLGHVTRCTESVQETRGQLQSLQELGRLATAQASVFSESLAQTSSLQRQLTDRFDTSADAVLHQQARIESLDRRTKLSLTTSPSGLFLVKVGDIISDAIASSGAWDPHVLEVIDQVAGSRNGLAIDVGANIGFLTVAMAKRFSRVLSLEPNAFNFQLLSANVALNSAGNVECRNEALFSHETHISLSCNPQQEIPLPLSPEGTFDGLIASNLGAYSFAEKGSGIFPVLARTLDSFNLADVALIKIDVQGADGEVIMGAHNTLKTSRPVVVFEWEEHLSRNFSVSFESVQVEFEKLGYLLEVLKRTNEKQVDYIARPR